ncbi:MAG: anaerobic nitric oxide reductase flavorubredoxin [Muribaculaceae bacterium]|nr:anaerobic nitric oxide reductase flavorubredoxin [Muribaculaceae bacterium]
MSKRISDRVTWVGKIDWELTSFHGDELSTHKGSSYNSYLIRDEKNVLIDTVWKPYDCEFVSRLKQEIPLDEIDYIVMNHNEVDHSGALIEILREIPNTPIYCTAKGEAILRGHYHQDWNFVKVKTGDTLNLGATTLTFIEAPMLHWPDTMFSYLSGENILFSNDGFGQHYATESLFNDRVCAAEVMREALKYYVNILNPFSPMVTRKVKEIINMNLPLAMICPSHGVIWKENPMQIVEKYLQWADSYQENQVTIVYDTMWQSTRHMAQAAAEGVLEVLPDATVVLKNAAIDDKNDILTEIFKSKGILMGSPTINNGYSYAIAGLLEMARGLKFKKKKAAAFGSFGWSGEAVKMISAHLQEAGFELPIEGLRQQWVPDGDMLDECRKWGHEFAQTLTV